jgi:acetyl-CoA acetyltransferase
MTRNVYVVGAAMTAFGKSPDRGLKSLGAEAIQGALRDAGVGADALQAAYMGNAAAPVITGQVMISGEVILRGIGIGRIPVINVENACATSATAFQQAAQMVRLGGYDLVLAAGCEKLYHPDKARTFSVFKGAIDVEALEQIMAGVKARGPGPDPADRAEKADMGGQHSLFMDLYASAARRHMERYGSTARHFAMISAKNSRHGALNPYAQFRDELTVDEVLNARMVAPPLTLPMCSPIGDGAAALVLASEAKARELGMDRAIRVRASVLASGWDYGADGEETTPEYAARLAYETAGIGPSDLDVVELHDASAPAELIYYELLGLAGKGEGKTLVEDGATTLGGRLPVNPSGGLLRKGHPIGATGAAQIYELVTQLRGEAEARQVSNSRTALAENGGGMLGSDVAAIVVSVLTREN